MTQRRQQHHLLSVRKHFNQTRQPSLALPMSGIRSDDEGRISFRRSCITVTAKSTVTLKLSFSPSRSEIKKDAMSRLRRNRMGSKKLTM